MIRARRRSSLFERSKSDMLGDMLLHGAAKGDVEHVTRLVECSCCVDVSDREGRTALMHAAVNGHLDMVKYLTGEREDQTQVLVREGFNALLAQSVDTDVSQGNVWSLLG